MYERILPLLDLSKISFKNVDIRGVDFRNTNAVINIREIYKMDATGCKFDDRNVTDWNDYDEVNLDSAELDENPSTMRNLDKAYTNEYTKITKNDKKMI